VKTESVNDINSMRHQTWNCDGFQKVLGKNVEIFLEMFYPENAVEDKQKETNRSFL
jgi:hypothetical protein